MYFVAQDSRSQFQPDPLQLKLSSLGATAPPLGGLGLGAEAGLSRGRLPQRGEVIYEQKVSPLQYSSGRDSELFRRSGTYMGDVSR